MFFHLSKLYLNDTNVNTCLETVVDFQGWVVAYHGLRIAQVKEEPFLLTLILNMNLDQHFIN